MGIFETTTLMMDKNLFLKDPRIFGGLYIIRLLSIGIRSNGSRSSGSDQAGCIFDIRVDASFFFLLVSTVRLVPDFARQL